MSREPIPGWSFALVVVRWDDSFLLIQEAKHEQRWYLPAGRLEPGESFMQAALRETREEPGLTVRLTGIFAIEHQAVAAGNRTRVIFLAEPLPHQLEPKAQSDKHSLQARWLTLPEIARLPLRTPGLLPLLKSVSAGRAIYPLTLLGPESLV